MKLKSGSLKRTHFLWEDLERHKSHNLLPILPSSTIAPKFYFAKFIIPMVTSGSSFYVTFQQYSPYLASPSLTQCFPCASVTQSSSFLYSCFFSDSFLSPSSIIYKLYDRSLQGSVISIPSFLHTSLPSLGFSYHLYIKVTQIYSSLAKLSWAKNPHSQLPCQHLNLDVHILQVS